MLLCGSGTTGCHGALHGNPYTVSSGGAIVRRDAEWVKGRIGYHVAVHRPDVVAYLMEKLGPIAGADYLHRVYYVSSFNHVSSIDEPGIPPA